MKNYLSLLFVTVLILSACSTSKQFQQAPSLSFKLPKNAKEIAFDDFFKQYSRRNSMMVSNFANLYQIDSFYIGIQPIIKRQIASDELIRLKKGSEHIFKFSETHIDNTNYESTIKKYKNNREVLIGTFDGDWYQASFFQFSLIDPARTQLLVGVLQFPKTKKAKASILLDKFYKSIRFAPADTGKKGL